MFAVDRYGQRWLNYTIRLLSVSVDHFGATEHSNNQPYLTLTLALTRRRSKITKRIAKRENYKVQMRRTQPEGYWWMCAVRRQDVGDDNRNKCERETEAERVFSGCKFRDRQIIKIGNYHLNDSFFPLGFMGSNSNWLWLKGFISLNLHSPFVCRLSNSKFKLWTRARVFRFLFFWAELPISWW